MSDTPLSRWAAPCGFAAAALAVCVPVIAAAARPGYSHVSQFISELGETGAVNGELVSVGFAVIGTCVLLFLATIAGALPRTLRTTTALLAFAGVGAAYIVSAIARCDQGCPASGSAAQSAHNLVGVFEYVGALLGLFLLGAEFRGLQSWRSIAPTCFACAALVALGFAGMLIPSLAPVRGLSQRIAEVGIFGWIGIISATGRPSTTPRQQ